MRVRRLRRAHRLLGLGAGAVALGGRGLGRAERCVTLGLGTGKLGRHRDQPRVARLKLRTQG
jgi:hypothetical protein